MTVRATQWRTRELTVQAFDLRGLDAGAETEAVVTLMRADGNRAAPLYGPDGVVSGVTARASFGPVNAVRAGGTEEVGAVTLRLLPSAAFTPETLYVLTVAGRRYTFTMPDNDTDLLTLLTGGGGETPDPGGGGQTPVDPTPSHEFIYWHQISRQAVRIPSNAVRVPFAEPQSFTVPTWADSQRLLFAWETTLGRTLSVLTLGGFPQTAGWIRSNAPVVDDGKTYTYWYSDNALIGDVISGAAVTITRIRG